MAVLIVGLFIAGVILAGVDEAISQGKSLAAWGVICIGIGLIIWRVV